MWGVWLDWAIQQTHLFLIASNGEIFFLVFISDLFVYSGVFLNIEIYQCFQLAYQQKMKSCNNFDSYDQIEYILQKKCKMNSFCIYTCFQMTTCVIYSCQIQIIAWWLSNFSKCFMSEECGFFAKTFDILFTNAEFHFDKGGQQSVQSPPERVL